jgi:predicted cupin superfamily sugar epimerase
VNADQVIAWLGLEPHPEGGHYRELWRDPAEAGGRGALSTILYLLRAGERSAWHRVDAIEVWHYHAGAALELQVSEDGEGCQAHRLGTDFAAGEVAQAVVPAGAWQSARGLGAWTLVGCAVAPAFEFSGFELAPPGWSPGDPLGASPTTPEKNS